MIDFYEVLQVKRDSSSQEIRKSFRRLVKKYHPDHNQSRAKWAEDRIKLIIEAYQALKDSMKRAHYDCSKRMAGKGTQESKNHAHAGESDLLTRCRAILDHLLSGRTAEALELFDELEKRKETLDILGAHSLKDYLDCKFLLGELHENRGEYEKAVTLYEEVYKENGNGNGSCRNHLMSEVRDRLRDLYCRKIPRRVSAAESIECLQKAIGFGLPKKDRAFVYKKMAEFYYELNDCENAIASLTAAFQANPKLKGVKKICSHLNFSHKN